MDYTQCTPNPRKNKHLSLTEWVKIELMLQEGKTAYAIAKALQWSINTILHEIRRGSVDQIKAGKKIQIYLADTGQARYAENRKACRKPYQVLECEDFLRYIEEAMIQKDWSVDAAVGKARMDGSFRKTLSTGTLYHSIDLGLLRIKNHHLLLKRRRKTRNTLLRKIFGKTAQAVMAELKHLRTCLESS